VIPTEGDIVDQASASIANLNQRGQLLRAVREFFYHRDFVEVETPLLSNEIIPELHIEPDRVVTPPTATAAPLGIGPTPAGTTTTRFLQASPELHMKRLLTAGMPALFQITKSFRSGERGPLHHPEFTIVEWYRTGDDMRRGMQLLDEFCQTTLKTSAARQTSYAAAFQQYADIDPHTASIEQLSACAEAHQLAMPTAPGGNDRDEWLNLLLALRVEPQLGCDGPEILYDYPASQAALAETAIQDGGIAVAKRFELYWQGVELANGYQELTDAQVLRSRLTTVNRDRQAEGRQALPHPESLLAAMEAGLPPCAGCALGFDRLAMLACGAQSIDAVMAFSNR
jgi:lysyl-tRNA synthetase class 2